jgi:CRISPR system Cascade subunit CasA
MPDHSLLDNAVFSVGLGDSRSSMTLPQVLAALSSGANLLFVHLRPHQRPAWHAFVVQLAFLALEDSEGLEPPTEASAWAALLRGLTPDHPDDGPWCLVNENWQQPAFMQAPCSPGREKDFGKSESAVQDVDLLVTSRHHDEKARKGPFERAGLDALVYALVGLQGWSSFMGAGNYNSMRMNGGFSSRPMFRLAFARGSGAEFLRDLAVLREAAPAWRERASDAGIGTAAQLHRLLWLPAWDSGSLAVADVHPLCLEVCRRVRLVRDGGGLRLRRASSDAMRVAAKSLAGCVHDPWIPIKLDGQPRALTAQAHTLGYRSLHGILFDRASTELPLLARPSAAERRSLQAATLIAQVLISGDGRTDGFAERELPMPPEVVSRTVAEPERLALRARAFVELASTMVGKVLRSALIQFADGSDDVAWKNPDFDRAVGPWVARFEREIDERFFVLLFETIVAAQDDTAAQSAWVQWLESRADVLLLQATESLPTRDSARWFARARAERFMELALHKNFSALRPARRTRPDTEQPEEAAHAE